MHQNFDVGRTTLVAAMLGLAALAVHSSLLAEVQKLNAIKAINAAAATAEVTVTPLRDGFSVLMGSGGNIIVFNGKSGKLMIDSGIAVSQPRVEAALARTGPGKIKYLINTHHHWDHTDGNSWVAKTGATIIAHRNTLKHDSVDVHVDDWDVTFKALPPDARPSVLVDREKTLDFDGNKVVIEHFAGGHTDSDLWVWFPRQDVIAVGDVFWNGMYPFIDTQYGGDIDDNILWVDKVLAKVGPNTIIIPGHGAVADRAALAEYRSMLVGVRDKVAALKKEGKSVEQIIAARPTAPFDARYGGAVIAPDTFTRFVYRGL